MTNNSDIRSELEDVLKAYALNLSLTGNSTGGLNINQALTQINKIVQKQVEEIIGEDESYDDLVLEDNKMHEAVWEGRRIRNKLRAELRTKAEKKWGK